MRIEHIRYSLGQRRCLVADWCERHQAPPALRERMASAGLMHYHDIGDADLGDLACEALGALMTDLGLSPAQVDLIVYFHTQQTSLPAAGRDIGAVLGDRFGYRCPAFALSQQNCVSALVAMQLANSLFATEPTLGRVLLIGADAIGIDRMRSVNGGIGLHSDAAVAATLVREGRCNRWLGAEFLSFAEHYRGMESPPQLAAALDRQYFLAVHKVIASALRKAGMAPADLHWLLPHNVNAPGWQAIAADLRIEASRVFVDNIADKSHLYGGDGLINLADLQSSGRLKAGAPFLIFSMGYGGFFGATAFQH